MMTYKEALARLNGRSSLKLENNTYLMVRDGGIAVRLHQTDVVMIHRDGSYTLCTGGWETVTTKDRISSYGPVRVYSDRGEWFYNLHGQRVPFNSGVRLCPIRGILSEGE